MGSRSLTVDVEAAIGVSRTALAVLVELAFPTGVVRFASTTVDLDWDGNTYMGAGSVSGLEPVREAIAPQALALNVKFSGIETAYLDAILDDDYQGQPARVYLAMFNPDTLAILADPVLVGSYRMDEPLVTVGRSAMIQLSLENRMADWDRPRLRRYNHADQIARHPGDLAFEFVEELQDKVIIWGQFKGPVAPDPLKVFNRTIDKLVRHIPGGSAFVNAHRKVGDAIANLLGW